MNQCKTINFQFGYPVQAEVNNIFLLIVNVVPSMEIAKTVFQPLYILALEGPQKNNEIYLYAFGGLQLYSMSTVYLN